MCRANTEEGESIIEVYYYCSYTGSPVGFILGRVSYDGTSTACNLSRKEISPFIRACFESGNVRNAFGILETSGMEAESPKYFLLCKNLRAAGQGPHEPAEFYLDIAFVTDNREEYIALLKKGPATTREIADRVRDTMVLNDSSPFGFTIRGEQLVQLVQTPLGSLFDVPSEFTEKPGPILELTSIANIEIVERQLSLSSTRKCLVQIRDSKWVEYTTRPTQNLQDNHRSGHTKKSWKDFRQLLKICLLVAVVIAIIATVIWAVDGA